MNNDIGEFVAKARRKAGLTQAELAKALGQNSVAGSVMVSKIENRRGRIPDTWVIPLCEALKIEYETLLNLLPPDEYVLVRQIVSMIRSGKGDLQYEGMWGVKGKKRPVYEVGASWEALHQGEVLEMVFIGDSIECSDEAFLCRVRGNSMEPLLYEGDKILVDPSRAWSNGKVCVLVYHQKYDGDEPYGTVKRVYRLKDGKLRLVPENREYPEQIITPEDMDNLRILPAIQLFRYLE